MWSRNFPKCVRCGGTKYRMMADGLCAGCYLADYREANKHRIAKQKSDWYKQFVKGTDRGKVAREQRHFGGERDAVLKRDDYRCVKCGSNRALVVHHKDGRGRGVKRPHNDRDNLETNCRACHINAHRRELLAARRRDGFRRPKLGRWSRKWNACRQCSTTEVKHAGHGYCRSCIAHKI